MARDVAELELAERARVEREVRESLAARGEEPAAWVIETIRSGQWKRRAARNLKTLHRNRGHLARLRREGYTFDSERRLVAPVRPAVRVRRRFDPRRPSARRRSSRARSRSPGRQDDDPDLAGSPRELGVREARAGIPKTGSESWVESGRPSADYSRGYDGAPQLGPRGCA
jgi:hypothetical protein